MMNIETLLRTWDGEMVVIRYDAPTGAWIFIAIHSTRLGPALGGTRMKVYPNPAAALQDAMRLAAGMTCKFAVPNLPYGGGKAVLAIPETIDSDSRTAVLQHYGTLVKQLKGLFLTGPDLGTNPADMDIISTKGDPYVFCRTVARGGVGDSGPFTARGILTGIQVVCERLFGQSSLQSRRVLVQGTGSVGGPLINLLRAAGAIVLFNDIGDAAIHRYRDELGLEFVPSEHVYSTVCDIFAPCALGGILNPTTIPQLRCRAVAGGANNQLGTPEDADRLRERGILYAPDYVINVGGAMGVPGMESEGWSRERAEAEVVDAVRRGLQAIFEQAATEGISTEQAARRIAESHLAMAGEQTVASA